MADLFHLNSARPWHLDYAVLSAGALILLASLHFWSWPGRRLGIATWLLVVAVLIGGWFLVDAAGRDERRRMEAMMKSFASTYAQELVWMGHEQVIPGTSPDDPRHLQMAEGMTRWLKANPTINDIYTVRMFSDGRFVRIVDSGSDHHRDGVFDGEQELQTGIRKLYQAELRAAVEKALAGEPSFAEDFWTDPRGIRVTAMAPMRNVRGEVEAALAVDFDAPILAEAMNRARLTAIGGLAALLLAMAASSSLLALQRAGRGLRPQLSSQNDSEIEKKKLETLVDSIDGIVWEFDAAVSRFTFVSRQCERILGYTPEQWMATDDLWERKLHPDDHWAAEHADRMAAGKVPYSFEYRMIAGDGRTVWIREYAAVLFSAERKSLLVRGVFYDITASKSAAAELEQANAALVESSRFAGMAEVATGVLHNVGNVLNSVNVSGNVISERLRRSKVIELGKVAGLLTLQAADFPGFVARDPRGKHIPELISCVAEALRAEHAELLEEVETITRNIGHIKEIVSMQQGFAKGAGRVEPLVIQKLVEDAIKINSGSLARSRIALVQAYEEVPQILGDKHLILQILVNLLRNAKQAIQEANPDPRRIVVKIQSHGDDFVRVAVQDTGSGIAPENLTRIFSHGMTTKKSGHGFGLQSSLQAATGMGGSIQAQSDGPGTGSTFTLELRVANPQRATLAG